MKDKILEIAEIAKTCPENLQQACFETLLNHFLEGLRTPPAPAERERKVDDSKATAKPDEGAAGVHTTPPKQEDLKEADLHLKARKFMQKEGITISHLNNLFYKEGDKLLSIYDELKTTRMAESQVRITLLQALVNAISSGEFEAQVESVRRECGQRKCYDSANFTATFKNNKSLFDFSKFDKNTKSVRLSDAGRKELGDLVKELQ